ncbi:hypothetical protein TNIN_52241 [Trichonephila inaurata madagascariensis]|uniref:Uncharacterized protein n=1 Tax=Trichonephila inaurata madagascariensis TaxID=2747483 RepID=A0A8X6WQ62_9ARAC|nr:hypothetical protein TNIN_52241 [Trichonephila inaurata madagascariensis]
MDCHALIKTNGFPTFSVAVRCLVSANDLANTAGYHIQISLHLIDDLQEKVKPQNSKRPDVIIEVLQRSVFPPMMSGRDHQGNTNIH